MNRAEAAESTPPVSRAVRDLVPSATLAMNERSTQLVRQGRKVYRLGFGQSPFPVPAPVVEALRGSAAEKDYLPVRGLPALRDAVARYHRRRHGIDVSADDVLIGPGSKELLFLAQLACESELVLASPSWVSYEPQARILGRPVHWIQTRSEDRWRLIPEQLEEHCRRHPRQPRLMILNYPDNPTGLTYAESELGAIAEVARKFGILVLSDEIYGEMHHEGAHVSLAKFYPEGTVISGGLSKWCGAGGWRLGTLAFPRPLRWLLEAVACVASETYSAASAPVQYAAVRAYEGGPEIDAYLRDARRILRAVGDYCYCMLRSSGVQLHPPEGGFYLFPDFSPQAESLRRRGIEDGLGLCEKLLAETGVALLPGSVFGRPAAELTCRLAYVDFDGARCLEHVGAMPPEEELDRQFLAEHCPDVVAAMERIGDWMAPEEPTEPSTEG